MEENPDETPVGSDSAPPVVNPGNAPPEPAGRPRVWPALVSWLVALAIAIGSQAVIAAGIAIAMVAGGVPPAEIGDRMTDVITSPEVFLLFLIAGPGAFGVVAWAGAKLSRESVRQRLGYFAVRQPAKTYTLTVLGSIAPLAVAIALATAVASVTGGDEGIEAMFQRFTPLTGITFVIVIALVPGFCEEMLFRGYIQRRLLERWGPGKAIAVSSIVFALAHVMPPSIAVALPLGVWFGVIAWRTGSIGPTIACHAFVNGGLNAWRLTIQFGDLSEQTQAVGNVVFVLIGIVCFVLACRHLASNAAAAPTFVSESSE